MTSPQPTRRPRAVLYSRLSRSTLESTSMEGQREDLFGTAEREGWDVVATFVDEGLSGGKRRANAEAALTMIADGQADVLAAYSVDRYSRQGIGEDAAVIRVIDAREAQATRDGSPRPLAYFAREGIRSDSGPDWRLRFALSSEMARGERDVMVSRRKRSIHRLQTEGRFTGRGPAPWGYRATDNPTGAGRILVPDPDEAAVIRATAARLIAGESTTSVCHDMTRRGIPGPRSPHRLALLKGEPTDGLATGLWTSSSLIQALLSQALLGRIARRVTRSNQDGLGRYGELVPGADGNPLEAFEPILSMGDHLALRERFKLGQGRGQQRTRRAARLGSGLVYCGVCGFRAYVVGDVGSAYYRCSAQPRGSLDHPGGLRIKADIVEDAIEAVYLGDFGRLPAVQYIERDTAPALTDAVARATERIRSLADQMTAPGADVLALSTDLARASADRDALLAAPAERTIARYDLGGTWADAWAVADLDTRRGYLADAYDHVDIFPATAARRVVAYVKPTPDESPDYYAG